eukprot:TRINITY_DN2353_c0_g1_i1.p1 TRINITY_DN2353_c0_g1~~TRINITY_DN2353_c0_g1_i1.p1  ORF type:complete len:106 (-),score=22.20 TRINITY_DN2353_c0_g1_i1:115-432(-)
MQEDKKLSMPLNPLELMFERLIQVTTTDGRVFIGVLRGLDQALNALLSDCIERVYSKEAGVETAKLGLYLIRGENIAILGEIDEDTEANLDFPEIKAAPLKPIVN